ncbi:hypothetical protein [Catenuloplanes indicus]|uniref:Uncharacterized protein n=1 Tax=Catenuloplanes indicus TaxID=137267 RepID=A0AAE4AWC2_9ACTN|nr:hypothetical protein [Catenuloplanes indicus]MDQ0365805.1 hypothetical protein [Catenuloplanes indicus]
MDVSGSQGFQIGSGNNQTNNHYYGTGGPPHSAYLDLVRHIAPRQLLNRDAELAQMASFCLDPEREPYLWWRARAWSGKTALLAWFVLHPPPGVQVVSFFIAGRVAHQATQAAFAQLVLEQLAALLNQPLPAGLTPVNRPGLLMRMLADAAAHCRGRNERLVLVVDGLDEDLGNDAAGEPTIADLLPATPADGLRIIVSSRPNPPVDQLVSRRHPLNSPGVVRELAQSPHAEDIERVAVRELNRIACGEPPGAGILSLITAALGGLDPDDLADLAQVSRAEITTFLDSVRGRTFLSRPSVWFAGTRPGSYVLGHQELQRMAERQLRDRLPGDRRRLHDWFDRYQALGWPAETPEYLLRGYFQMTRAVGDHARMLACAIDPVRHDRMDSVSGGDTAALGEIAAAQAVLLGRPVPDLAALVRLSIARERLTSRNTGTPTKLPVAWAKAGELGRAESLAYAITDVEDRAQALAELAAHAESVGDRIRAARMGGEAIRLAAVLPAGRLATLAVQADTAGLLDYADALTRAIGSARERIEVLERLALNGAERSDVNRHRTLILQAVAATEDVAQVHPRSTLTRRLVLAAGLGSNDSLAADVSQRITDPAARAEVLAELAGTLHQSGHTDRALAIASALEPGSHQSDLLSTIAETMDESGKHDDAIRTAEMIVDPEGREGAIANLAELALKHGDRVRAIDLIARVVDPERQERAVRRMMSKAIKRRTFNYARKLALAVSDADRRDDALARLVEEMEEHGWVEEALQIALTIPGPKAQARALEHLIDAMQRDGHDVEAVELADRIRDVNLRADQLTNLATSIGSRGDYERALEIVNRVRSDDHSTHALSQLARIAAAARDHDQAIRFTGAIIDEATRSEALARLVSAEIIRHDQDQALVYATMIDDEYTRTGAIIEVVTALVQAGELARAATLAGGLPAGLSKANALAMIAADPAVDPELRTVLAQESEELARLTALPYANRTVLAAMASVAASRGERERAASLVAQARETLELVADVTERVETLERLARAAREIHDAQLAAALVAEAETTARNATTPAERRDALVHLALTAWADGEWERAGKLVQAVDRDWRDFALDRLFELVLGAQNEERATEIARSMSDPFRRAAALSLLAKTSVDRGDVDHARKLLFEIDAERRDREVTDLAEAVLDAGDEASAAALTSLIEDGEDRDRALDLLVERAIRIGDYRRADLRARDMTLGWTRSSARTKIVKAAIRAVQPDIAAEIVLDLSPAEREFELDEIAELAVDHHQTALAQACIDMGDSNYWTTALLIRLSREAVEAGDIRGAVGFAAQITDWRQSDALKEAADAAVHAGQFAIAIEAAEAVDDESDRNALTLRLVQAAVGAGRADEVTTSAGSLSDPEEQAVAVMHLVRALSEAGEPARATDMVAQILDPAEQAKAYAFLAENAGDRAEADRLLARALAVAPWTLCLDTLTRLRPDVLLDVSDDYLAFGKG